MTNEMEILKILPLASDLTVDCPQSLMLVNTELNVLSKTMKKREENLKIYKQRKNYQLFPISC